MITLKQFAISVSLLVLLFASFSLGEDIHSIKKGRWNATSTWSNGAIPTAMDNVTITATDTVTIDTISANTANTVECNNLTVGGYLKFSQYIGFTITIHGNFTVNHGAYCVINTSKTGGVLVQDILLYGNITNRGQMDLKTGSSSTNPQTINVANVSFVGSGNDTVDMAGGYLTINNEFNSVTVNKSGAGRVILKSDMFLSQGSSAITAPGGNPILNLTRGIVETGPYALVTLSTTTAHVVGGSDSSYILGAMGRGLSNSAGTSKEFLIGDEGGFRPIRIRSTMSANGTGNYAMVRAIAGDANTGASVLSGTIDKVSKIRFYKITYHNVPGGGSSPPWPEMNFDRFNPSYGATDGVAAGNTNLRVAYSVDNRATWTGMGQTVPFTTKLDSLPRHIQPDSLLPAITLDTTNNSGGAIYVALARATGSVENSLEFTPLGVISTPGIPSAYFLSQNYPNPFNPSTSIEYTIPSGQFVTISLFNTLGQMVATLVNERQAAGNYRVAFDASKFSSGMYLYRITASSFTQTRRMLLVK